MNSESELLKALNSLVHVKDEPIEYRLHYNESGDIYLCTMVQHPESTQYIVVDKKTYDVYHKYRVVNGKLENIVQNNGLVLQLVKSDKGYKVVKNNASLLIDENETYPNIEYYDRRNN
jgi:hypothetical protein